MSKSKYLEISDLDELEKHAKNVDNRKKGFGIIVAYLSGICCSIILLCLPIMLLDGSRGSPPLEDTSNTTVIISYQPNNSSDTKVFITQKHCTNNEWFQDTARKILPPLFNKFNVNVRNTVELTNNRLNVFSYAYFPLKEKTLDYQTWSFNKHSPGSVPVPTNASKTDDPVEVLLYFTSNLFTAIGDLSDANIGQNRSKITNLELLVDALTSEWQQIVSQDILPGLSWHDYLKYPGCNGRVWEDESTNPVINTWSIDCDNKKHKNSELYLNVNSKHSKRPINDQIWGSSLPDQDSTTMQAMSKLIKIQIKDSSRRYEDLLGVDSKGKGNWATEKNLLNDESIDTYHKVRKIIRAVGLTIETFPDVMTAFYSHIPSHVMDFIDTQFSASITPGSVDPRSVYFTYGDIFCFNLTTPYNMKNSFNKEEERLDVQCTGSLPSLGTMLFSNTQPFTHKFFNLTQHEYDSLQAVLQLHSMKLGHYAVFSSTLGCPGQHASFKQIMVNNATDPFTIAYDSYIRPSYVPMTGTMQNSAITGTVCEVDDYMGDVHDLLVRIQQGSTIVNRNYLDYTVETTHSLQTFLEEIDLLKVLKNLSKGLCTYEERI